MASIQFYGKAAVIKAVENRDCFAWAIFQAKQFLFKYEGNDQEESINLLEQILCNLANSTAVYTIQFYEDTAKIKANTPHDGSFNFRLVEEEERQQRNLLYSGSNKEILNKIEQLQTEIEELREEREEEPETKGIGGIVMGLLNNPEKLGALLNIGKSLLSGNKQPVAISGIPANDDKKILEAIEVLKKNDPKIAEHLSKLAAMSESEKATFNYLVGMLDKM